MKDILNKIVPSTEERKQFNQITKLFLTKLNKNLKDAKAILGGSGAKDTWLAGNHDIDIFVQFDYKKYSGKSSELSGLLFKYLKMSFPNNIKTLHGSRDYFQLNFEGYDFEVVPILKISKAENSMNITDISPLHAGWVNKKSKKLKEEIRLTKKFFKVQGLYGAESHIAGFSGYAIEILIITYGSLKGLLSASLKWKSKQVIDPENFYKKDALFHLNKSKQQSPIIVVDPVDKGRNVVAALSAEKLSILKKVAKEFLKKPDAKFFVKTDITLANLKKLAVKRRLHLLVFNVSSLKGKRDVVGMKIMKTFHFLNKSLCSFNVKKSGWQWEEGTKGILYYFLEKETLPEFEIREGPPLKLKEAVKAFKDKNKNTFTKNGRIMAKIKIKHRTLNSFSSFIIKDNYVTERVKDIKVIEAK